LVAVQSAHPIGIGDNLKRHANLRANAALQSFWGLSISAVMLAWSSGIQRLSDLDG
jgi:hypothetical protein